MSLAPGSRIGPYEIAEPVGAGGMGEVFRAVDVNLGRSAAIKVLPSSVARDPERLARFEREAQTLGALNHPHIAQVFGFEKGDGDFRAIAMEFVEGPTLAERIAANGPIPIDEAIPMALQIAEALESAHDLGIVHRDLKPGNIKVRPDGSIKILDFGLAKALFPAHDSSSGALANSPTITTPAMTQAGVVLGTAAYMSPEQAKGRVVDRRADIWAFACVLFEMLTGKRAFPGGDVSEVMVSILRDEPPWAALPSATPPHVRSLLERCLQKDVRKRLPHIGVARLELSEPSVAAPLAKASSRAALVAIAAASVVIALGATAILLSNRRAPAALEPVRLSTELGSPAGLIRVNTMAIAPDGKSMVFVAAPANDVPSSALYLRSFDRTEAQVIPGTERGGGPMFSPDGQWIAFFASGTLKKVSVRGGPATTVIEARVPTGGSWIDNDSLVFANSAGLTRVQMSGGRSETIYERAQGDPPVESPQMLPGGRAVLYVEIASMANATIVVRDLVTGTKKPLQRGRVPRYVESGHVVYSASGTLFAMPFNIATLEGSAPVPVVERIGMTPGGLPLISTSSSGTLAYIEGTSVDTSQAPVMWLTRDRDLAPIRSTPASWGAIRLSPDGRRLAMVINDGTQRDIWVYDIERDIMTRITANPTEDVGPVWAPDGTALVFASNRGTGSYSNLYWQRADGTGGAVRLTSDSEGQIPGSFSPDGRQLIFHAGDPAIGRQRVMVLTLNGIPPSGEQQPPKEFVGGGFLKANPRFSPDGKWVAYAANYSGPYEIFVQPFPGPGERVQVSSGGGNLAVWSPIRNELYYVGPGQGRLMMVPFTATGGTFQPSKAQLWSETSFSAAPPFRFYGPSFDVHRDGQRFAVAPPIASTSDTGSSHVMLFFNFFDELRRLVPIP